MSSLRLLLLISAAVCIVPAAAFADEAMRQAQEELRRRKLYFGEIDGRASRGTAEALRQFQELKGFERTGRLDQQTRRALGLAGPAPELGKPAPHADLAERSFRLLQSALRSYEAGDIDGELRCYAEEVRYFDDGLVRRDFIRGTRERELRRWPQRRVVLLNRIATPTPGAPDEMILTARYRVEMSDGNTTLRPRVEDISFVVREKRGELKIIAIGSVD